MGKIINYHGVISTSVKVNLNIQNMECWYYFVTAKEAEKVECLLKCPHCGEDVPREDASFCLKCGKSLVVKQKIRTDLVLAAAMLTIISAAFSAGLGCLALECGLLLGYTESAALAPGFLVVGLLSIVVAVFGIVAGTFMLKRKNVNFSMLGIILLLILAFGNYITLYYWFQNSVQLAFTYVFMEIALFCEITILVFSILSAMFLIKSKAEFI
jgi:hypothetical protein